MKIDIQVRCPECSQERNGQVNTETGEVNCLFCGANLEADAFEFAEPTFAPYVPR